jgi:hypothetical protein
MRKDSLILLLMLAVFALVGADCQAPWDNDDEEKDPLPERALASSSLVRAYYETRTIPKGMRELKIPEGNDFEDDELTVEFDMAGAETVTEVRTHLYLAPPVKSSFADCDLVVRCISPEGTTSSWKEIDIEISDTVDPQAEVAFLFEFDGELSDGTWKIQIRDNLEDDDGRCVFRNGSLHINRGEDSTPGGAANETVFLDAANGNYGALPERHGGRVPFDVGDFGASKMLRNDFTFTSSFFVQSIIITMSFYVNDDADFANRTSFVIVAPSGNWISFVIGDEPLDSIELDTVTKLNTYTFGLSSPPTGTLMSLNGEPSAGNWTLYLVDTQEDGNVTVVTTDFPDSTGSQILPNAGRLEMTLIGIG